MAYGWYNRKQIQLTFKMFVSILLVVYKNVYVCFFSRVTKSMQIKI